MRKEYFAPIFPNFKFKQKQNKNVSYKNITNLLSSILFASVVLSQLITCHCTAIYCIFFSSKLRLNIKRKFIIIYPRWYSFPVIDTYSCIMHTNTHLYINIGLISVQYFVFFVIFFRVKWNLYAKSRRREKWKGRGRENNEPKKRDNNDI